MASDTTPRNDGYLLDFRSVYFAKFRSFASSEEEEEEDSKMRTCSILFC